MDLQDYEYIRNLTLLFFLERLLDKGEARSLHDLSCQFGTKGFSKEMRQIAGGSKAGLKKFLAQYPSLFTIQNDSVTVAKILTPSTGGEGGGDGDGGNSYHHQAMLYFKDKMKAYGTDIEVPIKSLLGHRSQAPPEVRHVSGQHVKEFRDFLAKFSADFVVTEETIYLKEYENSIRGTYTEAGSSPSSLPATVNNNSLTGSNRNSAVSSPVRSRAADEEQSKRIIEFIRTTLMTSDVREVDTLLEVLEIKFFADDNSSVSMPFRTVQDLKTFLKIYPHQFCVQGNNVSLLGGSNGGTPTRRVTVREGAAISSHDSKATLRDRVGLVLRAAVEGNSGRTVSLTNNPPPPVTNGESQTPSPRQQPSSLNNVWRLDSHQQAKVISNVDESSKIVRNLLELHPVVSLGVKGMNLGPEGIACSVQVGTLKGHSYIFDLVGCPDIMSRGELKLIIESEKVVKIMHDCRNESATLWFQFGLCLENVFDTQAAYAVLQHQDRVNPVYKVKNISLLSLCAHYNVPGGDQIEAVKAQCRKDATFWRRRPFDREMLSMLAVEVGCIYPTLYDILSDQITSEHIELLNELSREQVLLSIDPDKVKEKKRQRKTELEIADVKEKLSSAQAKNVVLSNREIRLLRYIDLSEDDIKKIKGSLKVAKKLEKLQKPPPQTEDIGSNPPSLESISSCTSGLSDENSPSNSPEHKSSIRRNASESDILFNNHKVDGEMLRIEKLEAMIADISSFGNTDSGGTPSLELFAVKEKREAETQTHSTGDIVMTKVYSPPLNNT